MKRILFLAVFLTSIAGYAQKKSLPAEVISTLDKMYADRQDINWKMKNDHYIVKFKQNKCPVDVVMSKSGEWIESETVCKKKYAPQNIKDKLELYYPEGGYFTVKKIENREGLFVYLVDVYTKAAMFKLELHKDGSIKKSEKLTRHDVKQ